MQLNTLLLKATEILFYVNEEYVHMKRRLVIHLIFLRVPILKQGTHLPVMVDVTHSTGRKDIMLPTAKQH